MLEESRQQFYSTGFGVLMSLSWRPQCLCITYSGHSWLRNSFHFMRSQINMPIWGHYFILESYLLNGIISVVVCWHIFCGTCERKYSSCLIRSFIKLLLTTGLLCSWTDMSALERSWCSCRGQELHSQNSHWAAHSHLLLRFQGIWCPLLTFIGPAFRCTHPHVHTYVHNYK